MQKNHVAISLLIAGAVTAATLLVASLVSSTLLNYFESLSGGQARLLQVGLTLVTVLTLVLVAIARRRP